MYSIHTSIKSEDVRLILSFDFQHPDVKDVCAIQAKIFSHLPLILNTNGVTKLFCVILNLTYGYFFSLHSEQGNHFDLIKILSILQRHQLVRKEENVKEYPSYPFQLVS